MFINLRKKTILNQKYFYMIQQLNQKIWLVGWNPNNPFWVAKKDENGKETLGQDYLIPNLKKLINTNSLDSWSKTNKMDRYITNGTFKTKADNWKKENLFSLFEVVVDMDFIVNGERQALPENVALEEIKFIDNSINSYSKFNTNFNIKPTAYIWTGRGLHLRTVFDKPLVANPTNIRLYEQTQKRLTRVIKGLYKEYNRPCPFNFDFISAGHLVRLVGSVNTKTNTVVEALALNEDSRPKFFDLNNFLYNSLDKKSKVICHAQKQATSPTRLYSLKTVFGNNNKKSIVSTRHATFMLLAENNYLGEGIRNNLIFSTTLYHINAGFDLGFAKSKANELNDCFKSPLENWEVSDLINKAVTYATKKTSIFSKQSVLDFNSGLEDAIALAKKDGLLNNITYWNIVDREKTEERKKEHNRKTSKRQKLRLKEQRNGKKQSSIDNCHRYHQLGLKKSEIAAKLGISRQTVAKYLTLTPTTTIEVVDKAVLSPSQPLLDKNSPMVPIQLKNAILSDIKAYITIDNPTELETLKIKAKAKLIGVQIPEKPPNQAKFKATG